MLAQNLQLRFNFTTLPKRMADENLLLYLNLTGELFYIVIHRMKSQQVTGILQSKVFNDLGKAIFNPEVIQGLLSGKVRIMHYKFPQMKTLMDNIVHSSIMSLSEYSLEKLFELTLIATKYQFSVCEHPKDILLIALNHVDSIRKCLTDANVIQMGKNVHNSLVENYGEQSTRQMNEYLLGIRNYVQEVNLKMTNLINMGLQRPDGSFVKNTPDFVIDSEFIEPDVPFRPKSTLDLDGDRIIKLGLSLYGEDSNQPSCSSGKYTDQALENSDKVVKASGVRRSRKAIQGLDLCSTLLGCELISPSTIISPGSSSAGFSSAASLEAQFSSTTNTNSKPSSNKSESSAEAGAASSSSKAVSYGDNINVVQFDARYNQNANKAALSALLKDLDLDATTATNERDRDRDTKNVIDIDEFIV